MKHRSAEARQGIEVELEAHRLRAAAAAAQPPPVVKRVNDGGASGITSVWKRANELAAIRGLPRDRALAEALGIYGLVLDLTVRRGRYQFELVTEGKRMRVVLDME